MQWLDLAMARLERSARLLQSILVATRRQQLRNLCSCAGCADCSGRSFNDGAGCKVLDHLHLCCVCLQLYIPPSEITKHSMQLPSTYEPLHCAAPVPVYACFSVYLFVSILCSGFLSSYIYIIIYIYICIYIYINIYVYTYVFYICLYLHIISLYLSAMFLAHVLRPNSFHRCSSCTSHCRSCTSLPKKRFR